MSYHILPFQKTMMLMVKTYLKKKLFVEFAWLNFVKEVKPSKWNAAARVNLLWPIKNVPLNGLRWKVTRHVMCANKRFRTYQSLFYGSRVLEFEMEQEANCRISMDTGTWLLTLIFMFKLDSQYLITELSRAKKWKFEVHAFGKMWFLWNCSFDAMQADLHTMLLLLEILS